MLLKPFGKVRMTKTIRAVFAGLFANLVLPLRPGELLTVSTPRNNFPLVEAKHYIFVAGGIGITPFIPMMQDERSVIPVAWRVA